MENNVSRYFGNTTTEEPVFQNPFSKPFVRAVFSIVFGTVFTICFFGKSFYRRKIELLTNFF